MVTWAWAAISLPWSQASDRRSWAGRDLVAPVIAAATAAASWPCGRCSSSTNRVVRPARVPIAEALPAPMIRSPSQWPGTARSAASAGRAPLISLAAGLAQRPPGPQADRQLAAQRAPALHVDRLAAGLVGHPHLRLVGELSLQHGADLLRRPPLLQPLLHPAAQPLVPGQLRGLRPPRPEPGPRLRRHRPVAPLAAVPPDLPAHRRRRPPQPRRDHP